MISQQIMIIVVTFTTVLLVPLHLSPVRQNKIQPSLQWPTVQTTSFLSLYPTLAHPLLTTLAKKVSPEKGHQQTNSVSLSVIPVDHPTADLIHSISGFLHSPSQDEPGKRVITEIRYICDCFGFSMFIRHSKYIARGKNESHPVLKTAHLECPAGCGFSIHIKTIRLAERGSYRYKCVFHPPAAEHRHAPDISEIRKILPTAVLKDAEDVQIRSLIKFEGVARFLEKCGFLMDRRGLQRQIKWLGAERAPMELECNEFVQNFEGN